MLRDTPCLRGRVAPSRSRDGGNSLRHKAFPGGHLTIAGANSPASLASRPVRLLLADEVDRYAASAGSEGDAVDLAKKRTTAFWNRKIVLASTPGLGRRLPDRGGLCGERSASFLGAVSALSAAANVAVGTGAVERR